MKRNDALDVQAGHGPEPRRHRAVARPLHAESGGHLPCLTAAAAETRIPLLGVCLGHQAIGQAFGGKVVRATRSCMARWAQIHHTGKGVFAGLPSPFAATRYHSLIVERASLPDCLEVTAELEDGTIMGLQHQALPIQGVQFHPESIASEHGHAMLQNFLDMAEGASMSDASETADRRGRRPAADPCRGGTRPLKSCSKAKRRQARSAAS